VATKVAVGKNQLETHPSWLTNIYENDKVNLKALLIVQRETISCECDPVMGGQIDFMFDVFNASVISVKVASVIDGYIVFQGRKFHDKPDPLTSHIISHGEKSTVTIRQRILPEVAKAIDNSARNVDSDILCFDFRGVPILIEEDTVIGKGASCPLNIAETMKFRVKESSMKGHHFYQWERIV